MLRVRGGWCDARILTRRKEPEWRVNRIVERMDDQVCGTRMLRISSEHIASDRAGVHIQRHVADTLRETEKCSRVQYRGLLVGRIIAP